MKTALLQLWKFTWRAWAKKAGMGRAGILKEALYLFSNVGDPDSYFTSQARCVLEPSQSPSLQLLNMQRDFRQNAGTQRSCSAETSIYLSSLLGILPNWNSREAS
jgi:hypothetical protein